MTAIYYALIVLPIIFITLLAIVFQSSVAEIKRQDFLLNCPAPINNGVATLVNIIDGNRLNYTVSVSGSQFGAKNYNGTFFECNIDPITKQPSANTHIKNYGAVLEFFGNSIINYGWFAWVGDTVTSYLDNIQPLLTKLYLLVQAPALVTNLSIFTYINMVLGAFIAIGLFMVIRGG